MMLYVVHSTQLTNINSGESSDSSTFLGTSMKGVKHYLRDGTVWKGSSHKMPNGKLHTNKTHTKTSKPLFHFKDLSKKAKEKAGK